MCARRENATFRMCESASSIRGMRAREPQFFVLEPHRMLIAVPSYSIRRLIVLTQVSDRTMKEFKRKVNWSTRAAAVEYRVAVNCRVCMCEKKKEKEK